MLNALLKLSTALSTCPDLLRMPLISWATNESLAWHLPEFVLELIMSWRSRCFQMSVHEVCYSCYFYSAPYALGEKIPMPLEAPLLCLLLLHNKREVPGICVTASFSIFAGIWSGPAALLGSTNDYVFHSWEGWGAHTRHLVNFFFDEPKQNCVFKTSALLKLSVHVLS